MIWYNLLEIPTFINVKHQEVDIKYYLQFYFIFCYPISIISIEYLANHSL